MPFDLQGGGLEYAYRFVISLAIGLLLGLDRERNPAALAGLRTFAIVSLLGTLAAMLAEHIQSPWLLVSGFLAVGGMIVAVYVSRGAANPDPGTTTIAALLVSYVLGALVWFQFDQLAIMLAITVTILLHFKAELRGMAQRLSRHDILSILQFAVLSFIILPVLPNRGFGPYAALNPHHIWLMVVLIAGVSLSGYLALKLFSQRYGAPLMGFFGGLVSSTATTVIYSRHSRSYADLLPLAVMVILAANLVVMVKLGMLTAVVAPAVLHVFLPVMFTGLFVGVLITWLLRRHMQMPDSLPVPEVKNPTEIKTALGFGLVYAVVLTVSAWLSDYVGNWGMYAVALVSGLTDVDAITLSSLHLFKQGKIAEDVAVTAITLAVIANLFFKAGIMLSLGGKVLARKCLPAFVGVAGGLLAGLALWLR